MRAWFNGRTGASQASNTSSILVVRSFYLNDLHYILNTKMPGISSQT